MLIEKLRPFVHYNPWEKENLSVLFFEYLRLTEVKARRAQSTTCTRGEERENNNACAHTSVQAVPTFIRERGYPIGHLASHDPQMFFKCVTQLHVYSLIAYSDLNQNCESKVIRMKESLLYATFYGRVLWNALAFSVQDTYILEKASLPQHIFLMTRYLFINGNCDDLNDNICSWIAELIATK